MNFNFSEKLGAKLPPLIIAILLVVVIAIGMLIFSFVKDGSSNNSNSSQRNGASNGITPVLTLTKDVDPNNASKVIISAKAETDDADGIEKILLPDGSTVVADNTTYEVEKNGTYEFTAYGKNGKKIKSKIKVSEIAEVSATNPYIPEGFEKIEGEPDSGFVIEDPYGNQYVWVPVNSGILTRKTLLDTNYQESSTSSAELVNSVAKYYGFYIARYEASQVELDGQVTCASISGKLPWTNINYNDAANYSNKASEVYGYSDCSTAILNSYAWDTVLNWIDLSYENYSSNTNYGNYSGTIYPTGSTEKDIVLNVADLAGNVREWTSELYKGEIPDSGNKKKNNKKDVDPNETRRIVRGGSAVLSRTPSSHIDYSENTSDNYWGFRMILYKK